ncbi:MAG: hypothetical protein IJE49_11295 [Agathobacter sp.]|nr:hypothetical protein [Agathobacter sp.]
MSKNMNQLSNRTMVEMIRMNDAIGKNVTKMDRAFASLYSTTLKCGEIWMKTEENISNLTLQLEISLVSTFETLEKISGEMLDDFLSTAENVDKLVSKLDEFVAKIEIPSMAVGGEESSSGGFLEKELAETVENGIDISDSINQLEPYIQEKLEDWLEIDDDDIPLLSMFSKLALAFYYNLGKEYGELLNNVHEVGEEARESSGKGVMDKAALYLYDTEKVNTEVQQAQVDVLGEKISGLTDKVKLFQQETTTANDTITQSYADMITGIGKKVETYQTDIQAANDAVTQSYAEMFSNMGTNVATWWTEDVSPWFTAEKWQELASGMQIGLFNKWLETELWWDENGELSEITVGLSDFLTETMEKWQELHYWWKNDKKGLDDLKLGIKIPKFKITFDAKDDYADIFKLFGLNGTPKFSFVYKKYATGGFPEDGWFRASHGEIMGRFDNGQSVVANNMQITEGIARGVRNANSEQNALLREQNALLRQILAKDTGISTRAVFEAVRSENRDYINRNGESAFAF